MIASIRRAAELNALAEEVRTNALRDGNIDPIGVVRLEGAASRDPPREPEPMSIEEHLAAYGAVEPREARQAGVVRETRRTARRPTGKGHPARRPRPPTTEAASDQGRAP
jgi:hypothetical protein